MRLALPVQLVLAILFNFKCMSTFDDVPPLPVAEQHTHRLLLFEVFSLPRRPDVPAPRPSNILLS